MWACCRSGRMPSTPSSTRTPRRCQPPARDGRGAAAVAVRTLRESLRSRTFWILVGTFWVCGWSTNGLIGTHFIPAAHDHGMPETTAAGLLALIGVFDLVGTIASGWLTDKVDPRFLLCGYYGLRGLSLLFVPALLGPAIAPNLFVFIIFYGLDWVATVPPTIALVPPALRRPALQRGLRVGVRLAHGRCGRGRLVCRLGPDHDRRLLHGLAHRRRDVPGRRPRLPGDLRLTGARRPADRWRRPASRPRTLTFMFE